MNHQAEFVVVGAGILGASAAYFLARGGARVTLLEAREPGAGATGASFAWINATSKTPRAYHNLNRRGIEAYDRLAAEFEEAANSRSESPRPIRNPKSEMRNPRLGLQGGGSLHLATGEAALRARCEELRAWGYPIAWLDAAGIRELEPDLALADGDVAAMHAEMDRWLDPPRLLTALLGRVREWGGRIVTGHAVTGLRRVGDAVRAVVTAEGEIPAERVVLAAGTAVPALAARAGVSVPVERRPGLLALTSPVAEGGPRRVLHLPGVHVRPASGDRFLVGAPDVDARTAEDTPVEPPPAWADVLRERLARWYPTLAAARLESARVCVRPMPADGFPIVGPAPGVSGLYLAVTHSGITLGPHLGEWIAHELLTGDRLPLLEPYRPERFRRD